MLKRATRVMWLFGGINWMAALIKFQITHVKSDDLAMNLLTFALFGIPAFGALLIYDLQRDPSRTNLRAQSEQPPSADASTGVPAAPSDVIKTDQLPQ